MLRRCAYCGGLTFARLACRAHSDLPALDPHYAPELRQTTTGKAQQRPPIRRAA